MPFNTFNSIQSFIITVNKIISSYIFPGVDASLALYYPLDNIRTPNYASGLAVYDAEMNGAVSIISNNNFFISGFGDLSLNNTMGASSTPNYVLSRTNFNLVPSNGLSISCWFSCSGQLNTVGTLVSLTNTSGYNTIELDISGTNMLCSNCN